MNISNVKNVGILRRKKTLLVNLKINNFYLLKSKIKIKLKPKLLHSVVEDI